MAFRTNKMPVLQEKSASGAVATFSTALAMPLVECKTEFMCTQEAGTPSPSNPLAITGVDEVHINMANFNQYIDEKTDYDTPQTINGVTISRNGKAFTFSGDCVAKSTSTIILNNTCSIFTPNDIYLAICFKSGWSGENDNWRIFKNGTGTNVYAGNNEYKLFRLPSNWSGSTWNMSVPLVNGKHYDFTFYPQMFNLTKMFGSKLAEQMLTAEQGQAGSGYAMFRQLFYKSWYDYNVGGTWVSIASVNGDTFPDYRLIDLDGTRYGGYVDVVNSKLVVTYAEVVFNGTQQLQSINFRPASDSSAWVFKAIELPDFIPIGYGVVGDFMCDKLKVSTYNYVYSTDTGHGESVALFYNNTAGSVVMRISDTTLRTEEAINNYLSANNISVVYRLNTPIEISLSDIPTLSMIIGNNSFASDSGSIDLTFKDLDIAKRGNFREVFRLPS